MSERSTELTLVSVGQQTAYNEMTADGKRLFKKINEKIFNLNKVDLLTRYQVGEMVRDAVANEAKFGGSVVQQIAAAMGRPEMDAELYQARNFALRYTPEQVTALLERRRPNGEAISWSHMRALSSLNPEKKAEATLREEATTAIFSDGLSVRQLVDFVKDRMGEKARDMAVAPSPPKSPIAAIQQVEKYRLAFLQRRDLWNTAIFDKLATTPPEQCTPAIVAKMEEMIAGQRMLHEMTEEIISKSETALSRMYRTLEAKERQSEVAEGSDAEVAVAERRLVSAVKIAPGTKPASSAKPVSAKPVSDKTGTVQHTVPRAAVPIDAARAQRAAAAARARQAAKD